MQLLTAVNIILNMLGEAQVTNTEFQHSTVYLVLTAIEEHKRLLLEKGWWFNTGTVTMTPNTSNEIEYPTDALMIVDTANERLLTTRAGLLWDASSNTQYFTQDMELFCTFNIAFEDLPACAAQVVIYRAGAEVYSNDLGVDSSVQQALQKAQVAYNQLQMLHLRAMKYTTKQSSAYMNILAALGG